MYPFCRRWLQIWVLLFRAGYSAEICAASFRHDAAIQSHVRGDRVDAVRKNCDDKKEEMQCKCEV